MSTITFDTHKAIQRLQSGGFDEKSAVAVVSTVQESFDHRVVTKSDIAALKVDIANLKVQMILWMAAFSGIIIAILKLIL